MQDIVSLDQAKVHLRLQGTSEHDDDVMMKVEEATALCLDYLKNYVTSGDDRTSRYAEIDAYDDESAPLQLRAAILRMTGHLFGFRGDDDRTRTPLLDNGDLPSDVTMFLKRLRDPALA